MSPLRNIIFATVVYAVLQANANANANAASAPAPATVRSSLPRRLLQRVPYHDPLLAGVPECESIIPCGESHAVSLLIPGLAAVTGRLQPAGSDAHLDRPPSLSLGTRRRVRSSTPSAFALCPSQRQRRRLLKRADSPFDPAPPPAFWEVNV